MRLSEADMGWLSDAVECLMKFAESESLISWSITWHTNTRNCTTEWREPEDAEKNKFGFTE